MWSTMFVAFVAKTLQHSPQARGKEGRQMGSFTCLNRFLYMFELFMFLLYDFDHFLFLKIFLYFYMVLYKHYKNVHK